MFRQKKTIIWIVVGAFVVAIAVAAALIFFLRGQMNADYYTLGEDSLPSVKYVLGKRWMSGLSFQTENGVETRSYRYHSETSADDAAKYLAYLQDKEGFVPTFYDHSGTLSTTIFAKQSIESGKLLIVQASSDGIELCISIQKETATLSMVG